MKGSFTLQVRNNVAEHVPDNRAKQEQNGDNNNGHKHQDQSVFYQTLTFFARKE